MGTPLDLISAFTSNINSTIKILEITYELKAVDEQTTDLLSTIRHVDFMLKHAHRLRRLKAGLLNTSEREMIDTVIGDTENALRGVARLVESCRVEKATKKTVRFGHRIMWLIRDNPSVRNKHQMLQICYQSLTTVFNCLFSKDAVVIAPIPEVRSEEQPPPYDPQLKELLNWQNRRKGRKSLEEKDCSSEKSVGLANGNRDVMLVANSSSPCLLAVELEADAGTSGLLIHTETSSELLPKPPSDAQPSLLSKNDDPLHPMTLAPKSSSASVFLSMSDSLPHDENQINRSSTHSNTYTDDFGVTYNLPNIDSTPFAAMMAAYKFNDDVNDGLNFGSKRLARTSIPASNLVPSSLAAVLDNTTSNTSCFPSLPLATLSTPAPSESNAGDDLRLRRFESSGSDTYNVHQSTGASGPGQHSLRTSVISDTLSITAYQSDRLDAIARVEDVMTRDEKAMSVGQGVIKRDGRSWLAYHATRSESEHRMDWDR